MKKLCTSLLWGLLLMCGLGTTQAQTIGFSVSPSTVTAPSGTSFSVDITTSNFTSVSSFQFGVKWDPTKVSFVSATNFNAGLAGFTAVGSSPNFVSAGYVSLGWADIGFAGITLPANAVLVTLNFMSNSASGSNITLTDIPSPPASAPFPVEVLLANGSLPTPNLNNAAINGGGSTTGPSPLGVTIGSGTGAAGTQVCVPMTVTNFSNLSSVRYSLNYNNAVLSAPTFQNFNLVGLTAASFTTPAAGQIVMNWSNNATAGVTVPNGRVIAEVCFTLSGAGGTSSAISITGTPTAIAVTNNNGTAIPTSFSNGNINISGGGGTGNTNLLFNIGSLTGNPGDTVCVPVTVDNFTNLASVQMSFNYSGSVLSYVGISGLNLTHLDPAAMSNPSPGNLTFSWNIPGATPISVPNGTRIFNICFRIVGTSGSSSPVSISGMPSQIEVINGNNQPVMLTSNSGTVTVSGTPPPASTCGTYPAGFRMIAGQTTAVTGTTACVEYKVFNFTNISSVQTRILYDSTRLRFNRIEIPSPTVLPMLTVSNFNAAINGSIVWSWNTDNGSGVTLADCATVFTVCFDLIGPNNCNTPVPLTFNQANSEVINGNFQLETFNSTPGSVTICNLPPVQILGGTVSGINGANVCVPVRFNGFTNMVAMQFEMSYNATQLEYTGVQSFGIANLSAANFNQTSGRLNLSWDANPPNVGITISNTTTAFEVCYKILVPGAATSTITFGGNPVEFVNMSSQALPFTSTAGTVNILAGAPCNPIVINGTTTNPTCNTSTNGAITTTTTGGNNTFTYSWSNGATTASLTGLAAGVYTVTVSSCAGGTSTNTRTFTLTAPSPLTETHIVTGETCAGSNNGSIALTVTGGTAPYVYFWAPSGTAPNTASTATGLAPGQYSVAVRDANSCQIAVTNLIVAPASQIIINGTINPTTGGGNNGSIVTSVSGGTGPYTYSWTPPATGGATVSNLPAGNYTVTVTDSRMCTRTRTFQVAATMTVSATATQSCPNQSTGVITVNVVGGIAPFTYNAGSGTVVNNRITGLAAGNYIVTVTDSSTPSQSATVAVPVGNSQSPGISGPVVTPDMNASSNGTININVNPNSTGTTTYVWSNTTQTTQDIIGLAAGNYCVTVTNGNGCTATACYDVAATFDPLVIGNVVANAPLCSGQVTGSIVFTPEGGVPSYNVAVTGPGGPFSGTVTSGNDYTLNGLASGTYSVTVTDNQNVSTATQIIVPVTNPITLSGDAFASTVGTAPCNGRIEIQVNGGTTPYEFSWSSGANVQNPTGLCEGNYFVTITDANGCTLEITEPYVITYFRVNNINVTANPCLQDNQGSINFTVPAVNTPLTYLWSGPGGASTVAPPRTGLVSGIYGVTVTDQLGTTTSSSFEVTTQSRLDARVLATTNFNGFTVKCNGNADGAVSANGVDGIAPYTYTWSNGATTESITGLTAGNYSVTIQDGNNCQDQATIMVTEPEALTLSINTDATRPACDGRSNGQISINPQGGVFPYTYLWDDQGGQVGRIAKNLAPGEYTVVVRDNNGCFEELTTTISDNTMTITMETTEDSGTGDGTAEAIVVGGSEPYAYVWNTNPVQTSRIARDLTAGTYFVMVTDKFGCQVTAEANIADGAFCLEALPIITPDGDGRNELFTIQCIERYPDNHLEIFNRWGQLVFETDNYDNNWSGMDFKGNDVPTGAYFFVFEYKVLNGNTEQVKGSITVLR